MARQAVSAFAMIGTTLFINGVDGSRAANWLVLERSTSVFLLSCFVVRTLIVHVQLDIWSSCMCVHEVRSISVSLHSGHTWR